MRENENQNSADTGIVLLELPTELVENILSRLDYHEISESRQVCQKFNKICMTLLNQGFSKVDKFHAHIQKHVKNQLPRRESERRNHTLARHVDILSAIETRLSLLGMTFMRYIDMELCCFIPGKVLDELFTILRALQTDKQPPRSHEFLQELRDISSMAMEHFEEKIAPGLKAKMPAVTLPFPFADPCSPEPQPGPSSSILSVTTPPLVRGATLRHDVNRMQVQLRSQTSQTQQFKKDLTDIKNRFIDQSKRISEQEKKITAQGKVITEQGETILQMERKINDLTKKMLEYDQKVSETFKFGNSDTNELNKLSEKERTVHQKGSISDVSAVTVSRNTRQRNPKRKVTVIESQSVKKSRSSK